MRIDNQVPYHTFCFSDVANSGIELVEVRLIEFTPQPILPGAHALQKKSYTEQVDTLVHKDVYSALIDEGIVDTEA